MGTAALSIGGALIVYGFLTAIGYDLPPYWTAGIGVMIYIVVHLDER